MKTVAMLLTLIGVVSGGLITSSAAAQSSSAQPKVATRVVTLNVSGMTCAGCEAAVKIAAKRIDGVKDVTVSYNKTAADVTYDPAKTTPAAIAKVITDKTGFKAEVRVKKTV